MSEILKADELVALIRRVFQPQEGERNIGVLVDLPDADIPDHPEWQKRREGAAGWISSLRESSDETGWDVTLVVYRNVRRNNADLPARAWVLEADALPGTAEDLEESSSQSFEDILRAGDMFLAPTELSATAPLKLMAPRLGFRAATMPGFSSAMIPALRLDYVEINRRVLRLKDLLDRAERAEISFLVDGQSLYRLGLDLRYRGGHASGGLLPRPGMAGNLPSGEAYIVPHEGEQGKSESHGTLPVEIAGELVLYHVEENRVQNIVGEGPQAEAEREHLCREPAYGNLAELGLGVLGDFGLHPIGEILLDEKLGLHIAFGRSDHFGGMVGAGDFSSPEAVIHLDRVFVPGLQPRVLLQQLSLVFPDSRLLLMRNGEYIAGLLED